jgi:ABC-type Na+ efflux pump permease subunit
MDKFLQVEKQYQVENDFFTYLKRIPGVLKVLVGDVGLLVGGIGGLIIGSILILAVLFTLFAVCAFVSYGIGCFF